MWLRYGKIITRYSQSGSSSSSPSGFGFGSGVESAGLVVDAPSSAGAVSSANTHGADNALISSRIIKYCLIIKVSLMLVNGLNTG
jgi:hypothetical protein